MGDSGCFEMDIYYFKLHTLLFLNNITLWRIVFFSRHNLHAVGIIKKSAILSVYFFLQNKSGCCQKSNSYMKDMGTDIYLKYRIRHSKELYSRGGCGTSARGRSHLLRRLPRPAPTTAVGACCQALSPSSSTSSTCSPLNRKAFACKCQALFYIVR